MLAVRARMYVYRATPFFLSQYCNRLKKFPGGLLEAFAKGKRSPRPPHQIRILTFHSSFPGWTASIINSQRSGVVYH